MMLTGTVTAKGTIGSKGSPPKPKPVSGWSTRRRVQDIGTIRSVAVHVAVTGRVRSGMEVVSNSGWEGLCRDLPYFDERGRFAYQPCHAFMIDGPRRRSSA